MGSRILTVAPLTCHNHRSTMNHLLVLCLHLFAAQGLFFNTLNKSSNKLSKRRVSSNIKSFNHNNQRLKKKSDYVCSRSSSFSESIRQYYKCPTSSSSSESVNSNQQKISKTSQPCYDDNKYCASWSYLNECSKNYQWMSSHCPIACGLCELCEDFKEYCEAWSRRGECSKNSKYMKIYCKKSCGVCGSGLTPPTITTTTTRKPSTTTKRPFFSTTTSTRRPFFSTTTSTRKPSYKKCRDKRYKCKTWAYLGYCKSSTYYHWMKSNCKFSCKYCRHSP